VKATPPGQLPPSYSRKIAPRSSVQPSPIGDACSWVRVLSISWNPESFRASKS
jgi:hypothetical protein